MVMAQGWQHWENPIILPAFGIGYRFQKPTGGIIFRTGISLPEAIYLSLGYSF